jgi:hypothetical protein
MSVLNPILYERLRVLYGNVRIANEGVAMVGYHHEVAGRMRFIQRMGGEYSRSATNGALPTIRDSGAG